MNDAHIHLLVQAYGKSSTGSFTTHHYSRSEKFYRSVKIGSFGLLFTCVSVLIPVAHFLLVPLGLLTTMFLTLFSLKQTDCIVGGEATCPHCHLALLIEKQPLRWPIIQGCSGCSRSLHMTPLT